MSANQRGLIEEVLAHATEDWVHLADFVSVARRISLSGTEELRALTIGLVAECLSKRLIVAGDADELGFHPWGLSPGDTVQRIAECWDEDDLSPSPGAVAWFRNTEAGDKLGELVLNKRLR